MLGQRYGKAELIGRSRIFQFGSAMSCSLNYSRLLGGHKFFFGLSREVVDPAVKYPETRFGDFVLLVCGSADTILVLPRSVVIEMMQGVTTRRLDVFRTDDAFVLQTTAHPKLDVTEFLNAFPRQKASPAQIEDGGSNVGGSDRIHLRLQWGLILLGRAEGCSVWVPQSDRNLSYRRQSFARDTLDKLPNFGFDENTRRIVQNIDVLWLTRNVIRKAFEIESSTSIYSGLLRLNDLVLAQPNNRIELYVVASSARRQRVHNQLIRPTFQPLIPKCEFVSFEAIEEQMKRVESFPVEGGARVTGLIKGERFQVAEHYIYPSGV